MKGLLVFFVMTTLAFAQSQFPVDTSYTVKSVYDKIKKDHPYISYVPTQKYENVIEKKEIVYKKIEDRALHLDAYFLKEKKRNPAIVILHGGGWKSGNKSQMETFAIEMASKGFSCFNIEFRLSPEAPYPAAIFDVKKAVQYIKEKAQEFNVDTTKIAVLGCSSGGQMASLVGTTNGKNIFEKTTNNDKYSSKVNAIINIDGILAFKHPESAEGKAASFWLGGSYEEIPRIWEQASPLNNTDKNTPPVLFINSSIPRFHAGRDDMIAILNQNGIYYEVQSIPNSPHSFWFFNPWFDETIKYTSQFLDKVFK
ncbi:alpha/beta hydrolase [Flavobacterium nackdongense]|uniref:Alpha/beta hydrolase n=1 Tax=Flavobacterium nackdongense TaxID=2547394 RepID=A0A4P6Y9A9_9FLAO|nr:alpha/beta hydrolase [Flavobacterium nackdongense]QBN19526.1 alpha/beta hydrolase [Flavobacterium nackdongense]